MDSFLTSAVKIKVVEMDCYFEALYLERLAVSVQR